MKFLVFLIFIGVFVGISLAYFPFCINDCDCAPTETCKDGVCRPGNRKVTAQCHCDSDCPIGERCWIGWCHKQKNESLF
uniref:Uncharacterized protein n=1 Tax=Panagrolaimus sp. PS1159 TaxID=55785 RepID=A0AC35GMZ8_9BILA